MGIHQGGSAERPATFFDTASDFRQWLAGNHDSATELWVGLRRKHVPDRGMTWEDAVLMALCFGWIDSVSQRIDEDCRRQRFTPRRPGSVWSPINLAHVERLIAQGSMEPAGLAAYESRDPRNVAILAADRVDLELSASRLGRLQGDAGAWAFWQAATPGYRRTVVNWVESAKQESTRERRLDQLISDSAAGRMVPPTRAGQPPTWLAAAAEAAAESAAESAAAESESTTGN